MNNSALNQKLLYFIYKLRQNEKGDTKKKHKNGKTTSCLSYVFLFLYFPHGN